VIFVKSAETFRQCMASAPPPNAALQNEIVSSKISFVFIKMTDLLTGAGIEDQLAMEIS
jgi:hypothetical protein